MADDGSLHVPRLDCFHWPGVFERQTVLQIGLPMTHFSDIPALAWVKSLANANEAQA